MTPNQAKWMALGGLLLTTIIAAIIAISLRALSESSNAKFTDGAAVIAFVTAASVTIERFLEMTWTIIGGLRGTFWPLTVVGDQVQTFVNGVNDLMKPFHADLTARLDELENETDRVATRLNKAEDEVRQLIAEAKTETAKLAAEFDKLSISTNQVPQLQRAQLLAAAAARDASYLQAKYGGLLPQLKAAEDTAKHAINGLQDFLATFKDNPARRLISLFAGVNLGLGIAGLFRLDMFAALLGAEYLSTLPAWVTDTHGTTIATGIIIGFGSNPTHEVIRALQEFKERHKGINASQPDLPAPGRPGAGPRR